MKRLAGVAFAVCGLWGALWAGVAPRGTEFQVNTYTTGYQWQASVASDAAGNVVVVWQSGGYLLGGGIFGRLFDGTGTPRGPEFRVNTYTAGAQGAPSVASDATGNFVVMWDSYGQDGWNSGIFGRRFDTAGTPRGPEFQVNQYTTGDQIFPSVASDATGDFVVVWDDWVRGGVFGRRFDSAGSPLGPEFQVNTYTKYAQSGGTVASDAAGNFVVAWQSGFQDGSDLGIFGQRFDSAGTPRGLEFQVNTYTTDSQRNPSVASDAAGNFVVVWDSGSVIGGQDGSGSGVFGRRFDSAGSPTGPEFQVNTYTTGNQAIDSVALDASGNFVVVWSSYHHQGFFGRRFDDTGTPLSPEFQVNTYGFEAQEHASVASDAAGNFVAAWQSWRQDGSDWGIFSQRFFGRSPTLTDPLAGGTVDCTNPLVTRPTIAWDDDGYDAFRIFVGWDPGFGTGHQMTSGGTLLRTTTWTPPSKNWRKACAGALAANPSNPRLYIKVFGEDRSLSKRDPARKMYSPVVEVDVLP